MKEGNRTYLKMKWRKRRLDKRYKEKKNIKKSSREQKNNIKEN
jgi:hypothetical protein